MANTAAPALPSYLFATGAVLRERATGAHHVRVRDLATGREGYAFSGDLRSAVRREANGRPPFDFSGLLRSRVGVEEIAGGGVKRVA